MLYKQKQLLAKSLIWYPIVLTVTITVVISTISYYNFIRLELRSKLNRATPISSSVTKTVTALGYLEPEGEVIHLSAPNFQGGVRVKKLFVKEGSWVRQGQLLALVDSYDSRVAALEMAKKQVLVAQASLNQIKAGVKAGDISAQKAVIARLKADLDGAIAVKQTTLLRLKAELENVESENQRYQQLYQLGTISASEAATKYLRARVTQQEYNEANASHNRILKTIQQQLIEAEAKLRSMTEVRTSDVQAAQTIVESAKAGVKQAHAELELSCVRSPITGQILKINTLPGEIINNGGIVEIGRTQQMYAVAQIYETDIKKVRIGQSAWITSDALLNQLQGTITDIGLQLSRQNIYSNSQADTDNKIVNVKIRINNMKAHKEISSLSNLQVQIRINI